MLTTDVVELIISKSVLPTLQEQVDNLVRVLGTETSPGEAENVSYIEHGAIIGAHSLEGFLYLIHGMIDSGILKGSLAGGDKASVALTFSGWKRFEELRLGAPSGRRAFMAMEYGDARFDRIVDELIRPAIAATGFELRRLDDDPRAGLIDDRLRVEIRASRFIVADLTHRNPGAYWEAGYAEGLGKPVIYTCEKSAFDEKASHFDTNHHLHVLWEHDKLTDFVRRLKATVRASIPEARGEDG
jgi:hypothetical protein